MEPVDTHFENALFVRAPRPIEPFGQTTFSCGPQDSQLHGSVSGGTAFRLQIGNTSYYLSFVRLFNREEDKADIPNDHV
jgi:hypothetical protein